MEKKVSHDTGEFWECNECGYSIQTVHFPKRWRSWLVQDSEEPGTGDIAWTETEDEALEIVYDFIETHEIICDN